MDAPGFRERLPGPLLPLYDNFVRMKARAEQGEAV